MRASVRRERAWRVETAAAQCGWSGVGGDGTGERDQTETNRSHFVLGAEGHCEDLLL